MGSQTIHTVLHFTKFIWTHILFHFFYSTYWKSFIDLENSELWEVSSGFNFSYALSLVPKCFVPVQIFFGRPKSEDIWDNWMMCILYTEKSCSLLLFRQSWNSFCIPTWYETPILNGQMAIAHITLLWKFLETRSRVRKIQAQIELSLCPNENSIIKKEESIVFIDIHRWCQN